MPHKPGSATLADLRAVVGSGGWLDSAQDVDPYTHDFRRLYRGSTPLVLLPRDVAEVAQVLRICDRDAVALVPQGGNTSYCGAATPDESGSQIVLSMRRLNRIRLYARRGASRGARGKPSIPVELGLGGVRTDRR
jgi:FAD/FMN-containing dehydrogenase